MSDGPNPLVDGDRLRREGDSIAFETSEKRLDVWVVLDVRLDRLRGRAPDHRVEDGNAVTHELDVEVPVRVVISVVDELRVWRSDFEVGVEREAAGRRRRPLLGHGDDGGGNDASWSP